MDLFPSLSPSSSFLPLTTAAARPADDDVAATSDCHVDSRSCSSNAASSVFISRLHSQTDAAAAGSSAGRHSKAQRISDHWTAASSARTVPLFPFMTGAQLEETKLQALIYRFIASGQRPPAMYMQALSKTTAFNQVAKCLQTSTSAAAAANLEPYRCRRTDGKKWRCSRDVVPDQKYCERHLNRGRSNSRKPQQPVAATPRGMPIRAVTSTSSSRSSLTTTMGNVETSPKVPSRANNSPPSYNLDDIAEANREFSRICSTSGFQQPAPLGLVNPVESKINPECNLGSLDLVQGSKDHHKLYSNPASFALFRSPGFDFLPLTIPCHDWKEPDAIPAVQTSPRFAPDPELPDKLAVGSYFTRPPFEFCDVARWGGPLAEALRFPLSNFEKSSYDDSNFEKAAFEKSNLEKSSFKKCSLLTGCSSNCTSQRERQSESSSSGSTSNNFSTMGPLSKLATPHVSSCSSS